MSVIDGFIVKALSGFYYVQTHFDGDSSNAIIECRARGQFKLKGATPLVGDRVRVELGANGTGTVVELAPRKNELVRPPIANVDLAVLVFSSREPSPNLQLLDKFLVHTSMAGLETAIIFSKTDLMVDASRDEQNKLQAIVDCYARIGYPVFCTAQHDRNQYDRLKPLFANKITVFAGQSGVGKSSLLNELKPGLQLQTAEISKKLGRGRHTTRHVELFALGEGGYVADTPGFSQLDFFGLESADLSAHFYEFAELAEGCRFRGCAHINEPNCAVRDAVANGSVTLSRYESYEQFFRELKEQKRRY